jgi:hypothetical protein
VLPHLDRWSGGSHPHLYRLHTSQVIYYAPWKWNTISTNSTKSNGKEEKKGEIKSNYSYSHLYLMNDISEWTVKGTAQSVQWIECWLGNWGSGFDLRQGIRFSSLHNIYSCCKAHSKLFYFVGNGNAFLGGKVEEKWMWPPTSVQLWGKECMTFHIHSFMCVQVDQSVGGGFTSRFQLLRTECTIRISKNCASINP